jgi:glycosyltransferase involved in cell wall biosynthesis
VADLGIAPAVRFLGHRADVAVLMDQASLLVAPALHEAFGLSVVEAMAAGLPTVAAASGGHLETIGAVPGAALFPPGDAEAAGRLLALLGRDEAARDTCGRALQAAQRAHFTVAAQAEGTDAVYRTVR